MVLCQVKLARTLNRLSFYYSGYASRGGDDYLGKAAATEKALTAIETAIETLKEVSITWSRYCAL